MKDSTKKLLLVVLILLITIPAILGYVFYTNLLSKSKEDGKKIVSRAVVQPSIEDKASAGDIQNIPTKSPTENTVKTLPVEIKTQNKIIKSGQFVSLDPVHYAKGSADVVETSAGVNIVFSQDFVTNPDGPDLYVWLVKKQDIKNIAVGGVSSESKNYLDLGPIASKTGAQTYQVTKSEFEANDYAVVIWCRAFGIQFSNAILK